MLADGWRERFCSSIIHSTVSLHASPVLEVGIDLLIEEAESPKETAAVRQENKQMSKEEEEHCHGREGR